MLPSEHNILYNVLWKRHSDDQAQLSSRFCNITLHRMRLDIAAYIPT